MDQNDLFGKWLATTISKGGHPDCAPRWLSETTLLGLAFQAQMSDTRTEDCNLLEERCRVYPPDRLRPSVRLGGRSRGQPGALNAPLPNFGGFLENSFPFTEAESSG